MNRAQRAARRAQQQAANTTLKEKRKHLAHKRRQEIKAVRKKYDNPWRARKAKINKLYTKFFL